LSVFRKKAARVAFYLFTMRIAGITIPDKMQLPYALTAIYGVGQSRARVALKQAGIEEHKKAQELTDKEEQELRRIVEGYKIEGELRREISSHIKRLKDIKSYRGSRHSKRLPARGQRTRTNARTLKGVRKTMGSGRKTAEKT
jgi:small subunit ribosomal protein S13